MIQDTDPYVLAEGFPPGLNTVLHPADLPPNETPDSYGFDLSVDGRIAKSVTAPTGTSRIQKSTTLNLSAESGGGTAVPFYWHYERLWNITGLTNATASTDLYYGAPKYGTNFYRQGVSCIGFQEDANTILVLVPFDPSSMLVVKSTGSHVISNLDDPRGYFRRTGLIQELKTAAANQVVELDNVATVSNASGLFARQGGRTVELSRKVRNSLTEFASKALTADYEKKRIICGTSGVFEMDTAKLFRYDGSTFRFTSRQFTSPRKDVIHVERLVFHVEHTDALDGAMTYQVRVEDEDWGHEETVVLERESERSTLVEVPLAEARSCIRFQLRITDLDTNKRIRQIRMDAGSFTADSYRA